ncbi:phosphotransferase [Nocardiopsis tropica]|uniref:Phosphotransferase n=1 Tax=Nocardiopsis tropica TaxID=109330 RepID=A0ABV1ZR43_9ACTN|nr:phosphotransferase [Nocardiopsis tropica]
MFQALLFSFVEASPVSATPDLRAPLPHSVDASWWEELRTTLHRLGQVPVPQGHLSHTPGFLERLPAHLPEVGEAGVGLEVGTWVASHADLHWANLAHGPLVFMDWEGWAAAPLGYDAAVLHAYALAEPGAAAVVREVFADVLDTEEGRPAHLIICAEIVQAGERDPLHRRPAPTRAASPWG